MGNIVPRNVNIETGSNVTLTVLFKNKNKWNVSYFIETGSFFGLAIDTCNHGGSLCVNFIEQRDKSEEDFSLYIRQAKHDLLEKITFDEIDNMKCIRMITEKENNDISGYVAKTSIFSHAQGRGTVIVEQRSMHRGMNPYMVIFEQYYEIVKGNKVEYMLAMKHHISVSNNKFVISPRGPVRHSYSSCKKIITSRAESLIQHEQGKIAKPQVAPQVPYSSQSDRSVVANQGAVRGNNNGNVHYNQLIYVDQKLTFAASSSLIE